MSTLQLASSQPTIMQRVMAGVAYMDRNRKGWRDRIDRKRLNIAHDCGCVIGQEFGSFNDIAETLFGSYRNAAKYGFYAYSHGTSAAHLEYAALTSGFKQALAAGDAVKQIMLDAQMHTSNVPAIRSERTGRELAVA